MDEELARSFLRALQAEYVDRQEGATATWPGPPDLAGLFLLLVEENRCEPVAGLVVYPIIRRVSSIPGTERYLPSVGAGSSKNASCSWP